MTLHCVFLQSHPDPEFKINKKAMSDNVPAASQFAGLASLTYSSMFPNTPAMINWHGLRCGLSQVSIYTPHRF